jgi:hypothetical protein
MATVQHRTCVLYRTCERRNSLFFVLGKSWVKPLNKAVTVPKLELTAATLATYINKIIAKELQGRLKINRIMFWTDSMNVLKYIANETWRFVTFVANHVAGIRQESTPEQWRHVRSELNPAGSPNWSEGVTNERCIILTRWEAITTGRASKNKVDHCYQYRNSKKLKGE